MRNGIKYYDSNDIPDRRVRIRQVGTIQCRDRRVYKGWPSMKYMLTFHRFLFIIMLVIAFFMGALNAGRAEALEKKEIQLMLMMTPKQLTEIEIDV